MSKNIVIVTNIPSPYRVKLFDTMRKNYSEYKITVVYQNRGNFDRSWQIPQEMICNDVFLDAFTMTVKDQFDKKVLRFPRGVWKNFRKLKPDVVVISEYNPVSLMVMLWCRVHRVKYISWTDGTYEYEKGISRLQKLSRRLMIGYAAAYIASSTESKKNQIRYGAKEEDIYLSYLTVDTNKLYYEREEFHNKKLLFVGRLVETKGIDLLLDALCKLKMKDYTLTIVGDGADEEKLQKQVQALGLEKNVVFAGFHEGEELRAYYRENDIMVFPSRRETFGLVVLEAMCHSMPVICSKYAGCVNDLIVDGVNGRIIDPDDGEQLAGTIDAILFDVEAIKRMGQLAYKKSKSFSLMDSSNTFMQAIEKTL